MNACRNHLVSVQTILSIVGIVIFCKIKIILINNREGVYSFEIPCVICIWFY